jgi:hypothetical protein
VCALCRRPFRQFGELVDHCHRTDRLRGALCPSCNSAMGAIDRDPEWVRRAVAYRDSGGVWGVAGGPGTSPAVTPQHQ